MARLFKLPRSQRRRMMPTKRSALFSTILRTLVAFQLLSSLGLLEQSEAKTTIQQTLDRIIYVRDNTLWQISASGGDSKKLLELPWQVERFESISVASNGNTLLVQADGLTGWATLSRESGAPHTIQWLPCAGTARLSATGAELVCPTQNNERIAVYTLSPSLTVRIVDKKAETPLHWSGQKVIMGDKGTLLALGQGSQEKISPHAPTSNMRVAPNGKRAIGSYREGEIDVVYSFKLDGVATKRSLVQAGRLLSISAESTWAAIQQEVDACAVRISGGQYMCWPRFEALDISSHGHSLLLSVAGSKVGHDLYLGAVSGTKAAKPGLIVEGVGRVAVFWPAAKD